MSIKVFLLCGIPGSGKSTWANQQAQMLEEKYCIVSRDAIRFFMVKENEPYFNKENAVFAQFVKEINDCVSNRIPNIFIDATHISIASRAKILNRLREPQVVELSVEVFDTPESICLERNSHRKNRARVPDEVIKSMNKRFQCPTAAEFEKYHFANVTINYHIL